MTRGSIQYQVTWDDMGHIGKAQKGILGSNLKMMVAAEHWTEDQIKFWMEPSKLLLIIAASDIETMFPS